MLLSLALFFAGCQKYDDSTLNGRVDDLEGRVTELEKQIADLNSNVQTVSASVKALENEDRIVSITPLADGTGYEIEFSKMGKMVIKNGEKPSVSVEKGEDGIYYWTVDGEPLFAGGNRIPATIAPEFKIEGGQLWFRLNGGEWTVIPGAETGIGLVQEVTETDEDVTLVLSDGREITIPKVQSFALKVEAPYSGVDAGETVRVAYTVTAGDAETVVKAICDEGFTARVSGDSQSGAVSITAPDPVPSSASVLLVAVNGKGQMSGKILSFEQGQLSLVENTVTVGNQGGEITLSVTQDTRNFLRRDSQHKLLVVRHFSAFFVFVITAYQAECTEEQHQHPPQTCCFHSTGIFNVHATKLETILEREWRERPISCPASHIIPGSH